MTPTHPYWPMTPGSCIDYAVLDITGHFNMSNLTLDVLTRSLNAAKPYQSITAVKVPSKLPCISMVQYVTGDPVPTLATMDPQAALVECLWAPTTGPAYIGENVCQLPPEPKLTMAPTVGQAFTGTSKCCNFDPVTGAAYPQDLPWKFQIISMGAWGVWPDTIRTSLLEMPVGGPLTIYNYVFARGVGMVDFWWGNVAPDNSVSGWQMYGIAAH